jgi:hypothetical protein
MPIKRTAAGFPRFARLKTKTTETALQQRFPGKAARGEAAA